MKDNAIFIERLTGKGPLNFILLHNAGGSHLFFTHQIELFKKYGNVIWLDLPGHSQSKGISKYQMHDLSSLIIQISEDLSLENISLVGLNNGADIVLDLALSASLPIQNLILIDPPLFMDKAFVGEINNFITALDQGDYSKFVTSLVNDLFIRTDLHNKKIALDAFNSVDKKALQMIFQGLIEWDAELDVKLAAITYPTLCILTDEHHCQYAQLKQKAPQFELGKVIGSKCWATLEVPDQVNAMIERFLILNR